MRPLMMMRFLATAGPALLWAVLAVAVPAVAGCGGQHGGTPEDAAQADVRDGGGGGEAAPADGPGDARPDGSAGDGGGDAGGDGGAEVAHRFLSATSGGTRIESSSYRLELFIAPVAPVGATQNGGYKLQLGPGALRNAR